MTNQFVEGIYYLGSDTMEEFFTRIDNCGGWPLGRKFLTVRHTTEDERPCYFSDESIRDEWNTTMFSADEYYWWKMSDEAKEKHRKTIRREFAREINCRAEE